MSSQYAVEMINIHKTFPGGVYANQGVTLKVKRGEVHGLLGENGAGKTTLMNILYGLLNRDKGEIIINGEHVEFESPTDAISKGIGMVHQHFKLIPPLTVVENVVLGSEPIFGRTFGRGIIGKIMRALMPIDIKMAVEKIIQIAEENGLHIDPYAKVQDLSVGLQQRIEIIKTLYRKADILILDEPTSVLTPQEVDELFETLKEFRKAGKTIILITHKLRETMALCDRITVLRDGKLIGTVERDNTSPEDLAQMMVGRPVVFMVDKGISSPGDVVLKVQDLHVKDYRGLESVKGISFEVKAGEIFGVAGVEGNGQTELVEAITGLRKPTDGVIIIDEVDVTSKSPRFVREVGMSHIPEDRQKMGLILAFTIKENLILGRHYRPPFANGPKNMLLNLDRINEISDDLVSKFSIKTSSSDAFAETLSGGNQQKVVVARELAVAPKLIVAAQPTRGLDVGATEFIRNTLIKMRNAGSAILLVSAELDEVRNLSDRIGVIYDGKIVAIRGPDATPEELGLLMAGHVQGVD